MTQHFLIFGLPRSRTAWLANLLTHNEGFCFHEGLAESSGFYPDLKKRMQSLPDIYKHVGNADTSMIHGLSEALNVFPDARMVLLTENHTSWKMFADQADIPQQYIDKINEDYHNAKQRLLGKALFVPVSQLSDPKMVQGVWNHCMREDVTFDIHRAKMLVDLNIQVIKERLIKRLGIRQDL